MRILERNKNGIYFVHKTLMGRFKVEGIITIYCNEDICVTQTFPHKISSSIQAWISINTKHFYES